jgi:hypothetical protein
VVESVDDAEWVEEAQAARLAVTSVRAIDANRTRGLLALR